MSQHFEVPLLISAVYAVMLFGGQALMSKREAVKMYWTPIYWNVGQSLLSYAFVYFYWVDGGAYNILQHLGLVKGLSYEACTLYSEYANPWVFFFCLSKIWDMVDTLLLVVRKRQIIFLHWYHHITVILFCWAGWASRIENGGLFAGINAIIHSIMYTYYTVASSGVRFPNWMRSMVTALQIVQMVLGTGIVLHNVLMCNFDPVVQYSGLAMYLSYLALFVHFFYQQYCKPKPKHEAHEVKAPAAKQKAH